MHDSGKMFFGTAFVVYWLRHCHCVQRNQDVWAFYDFVTEGLWAIMHCKLSVTRLINIRLIIVVSRLFLSFYFISCGQFSFLVIVYWWSFHYKLIFLCSDVQIYELNKRFAYVVVLKNATISSSLVSAYLWTWRRLQLLQWINDLAWPWTAITQSAKFSGFIHSLLQLKTFLFSIITIKLQQQQQH